MKRTISILLLLAAATATHAQIAVGSATPGSGSYDGIRVSAQMRKSDPTVMDVDYIVYTDPETTPTVNVRCLAFEDGERGFATVVRPETFIEGTDANLGDGIAANVPHRLSWKVSSDWATDLAKVSFEVMAMKPGDLLLPDMHFVTIPAAEGHPKTIVSVNDLNKCKYEILHGRPDAIYLRWWEGTGWMGVPAAVGIMGHEPLLCALFWLYANKETELMLNNGTLLAKGKELVRHAAFLQYESIGWKSSGNALEYVFSKMGYRLLSNADEFTWIIENLRSNLEFNDPRSISVKSVFREYAVKTVEE